MARKAEWPPKIHTNSRGKEWVRLRLPGGVSRDVTLGPAGSAEARGTYARLLAECAAAGGPVPAHSPDLTVAELCAQYLTHAEQRYERRQLVRIRRALRAAVTVYGPTPASAFGPVALEAVRASLCGTGKFCRRVVNQTIGCLRLCWKWAAGRELIPSATSASLYSLADLRAGEPGAPPDRPKVAAVAEALVEQTLPHLQPILADMVRLQLLTGMRPGEVVLLRPADVLRPWLEVDGVQVWLYRLDRHKSAWRGHSRGVPLGPKAQAILTPYLERDPQAYCFSPRESRAAWEAAKRAARKTPVQPSQRCRRQPRPKRQPGERYTTESLDRAVARACKRAGLPRWAPNQIRHRVATDTEAAYDRDMARAVLGHTTPSTTARYAESIEKAAIAAARVG